MSYKFVDSFRARPGWNCSSVLILQYTSKNYHAKEFIEVRISYHLSGFSIVSRKIKNSPI